MVIESLYDKITEKWEAWSNREYVIFQHLDSLYKSQKALSKVIAHNAVTRINPEAPTTKEFHLWENFFEPLGETLQRARIKAEKSKDESIIENIKVGYNAIMKGKRLSVTDYADVLFAVGCLYDQLGYSSPERKTRNSPFVSDLDDGLKTETEEA